MNLTFKFVIDKNKKISLVIFKEKEMMVLLGSYISVLKKCFPNIDISFRTNHFYITGLSNAAMLSIAQSLLEEVYIEFLDDEIPDFEFDPSFF